MKKYFTLIFTIIVVTYCQAQKEKLELNLLKGNSYSLIQVMNFSSSFPDKGQQVKMEGKIYTKLNYKVVDILDSIYDMEVRIDSVTYKGNVFNRIFENQPQVKEDSKINLISLFMMSMQGKPYSVKMTKTGKFSEVKRIEADTSKLHVIRDNTFKEIIESIPAIFPDSMVSQGDKWTIKSKERYGTLQIIETTYELKEIKDNYLLISGSSNMKITNKNVDKPVKSSPLKLDMKGITTSEIKIDKKTGWIIEANSKQNMMGTAKVKEDQKKLGETIAPVTGSIEITITGK